MRIILFWFREIKYLDLTLKKAQYANSEKIALYY